MKVLINVLLTVLLFYFFFSCVEKEKTDMPIDNKCMPGYVLFVFMGEQNKPIYPVLLRANEKDTTYYYYIGNTAELYNKNGFIIDEIESKDYLKKVLLSPAVYTVVKNMLYKLTHINKI